MEADMGPKVNAARGQGPRGKRGSERRAAGEGSAPRREGDLAELAGLTVLRWAHGGDAVAIPEAGPLEGCVVFIPGAVPGDVVRVAITSRKRRWARARLLAVERPSPDRVEPPCPVQARCGGCPWMVGTVEAQARSRRAILEGEARKHLDWSEGEARARIRLAEAAGDEGGLGYRPRIKLGFAVEGDDVRLGYRARSTHDLVDLDACAIAAPGINASLPGLREALRARGEARGDATLVAGEEGVAIRVQPARGQAWSLGPERVTVRFGDVALAASPRAFLQPNARVVGQLLDRIRSLAEAAGGRRAVELFAGGGLLTTALWAAGYEVDAYEVDDAGRAAFEALRAVRGVSPERGRWHRADLLRDGVPTPAPQGPIDLVLLDAPRQGARDIIPWIRASGASAVILVSCDVATGMRDLAALTEGGGWQVTSIEGHDMFPHTGHQEILAALRA